MKNSMIAAIAIVFGLSGFAYAEEYPSKPIRFIVGYSPGGGIDTQARLVAQGLSEVIGEQVVVENRPGAGGTIAASYVAEAEADGYTLCFCETAILMGPAIFDSVSYDPLVDFAPVARTGEAYLALIASNESGFNSLQDLLESPTGGTSIFYASSGVATVHHISGEFLRELSGLPLEHVPFKGGSPAVSAVASGQVQLGIASLTSASSQAKAGNVKLLATTNQARVTAYPELQAIGEVYPGYSGTVQQYVLAPAGTSEEIVAMLSAALGETMAQQVINSKLTELGMASAYLSSDELTAVLPSITQRWNDAAVKVSAKN